MLTNCFKKLWAYVVSFVVFVLKKFEINDYYLVLNGNHEHIMKYFDNENCKFSAKAQEALIHRDISSEIELMLKSVKIANTHLKQLIIDRDQGLEIALLCQNNSDVPSADIVRKGHFKAVLTLLSEDEIPNEGIAYILKNFTHFQIMEILRSVTLNLTDDEVMMLIARGNDEEIEQMLRNFSGVISAQVVDTIVFGGYKEASKTLAALGIMQTEEAADKYVQLYADDNDMFMELLYNNRISDKLQLKIIKSYKHYVVMKLLEYSCKLCEKAQVALITKGNMEEIKLMIENLDSLSDKAIAILLERNAVSEIQTLVKHHQLKNTVLLQWVKNCRFDYVQIYLENHQTDIDFTNLLLLEILKRTVR